MDEEMSEGSVSGNEIGGMEVGGGKTEEWKMQKNKRKRKKSRQQIGKTQSDDESKTNDSTIEEIEEEREFKVIVKLIKEGESFGKWNPVKLTKAINTLVGNVKCAKTLRDGSLLVLCKNIEQKNKALKLSKIEGEAVQGKVMENKTFVRGVITGIHTDVSIDEIKDNIEGGKVVDAKRLKITRNGERCDSFSVMLKFEEQILPKKVYIGFMSYDVRPYIPPPLRCFKCQRYGHVAAICKGKQKCGRCAGDHEYGKCEVGAKLKCCNCGGEHSSAYRGCEASKRAVEVNKVKQFQGITYADAAKKVLSQPKKIDVVEVRNSCQGCSKVKEDTLLVGKSEFVLFMVDVINCTAQTERKTEKIKIIVKAAEKHLGIKGLNWESVKETLSGSQSSQSQTWVGGTS